MVFEKLYKFIGKDIKAMMERPEGHYCLRLHKNRVFYVSEALMKKATNVRARGVLCLRARVWCVVCVPLGGRASTRPAGARTPHAPQGHTPTPTHPPRQIARDKLVSLGTPVGKLTHSGKFRLTIGALDVLSRYAKHKVRVRGRSLCGCWARACCALMR
jgi:60S ribosome subunit biogenesis protein NIP7